MSPNLRHSLPILYTSGTYYEVGYNIGATFKNLIHEFFQALTDLYEIYVPFYNTQTGKEMCDGYLEVCKQVFPQYMEEMRGIANGAKIDFHDLFLVHIIPELDIYLDGKASFGCTTVYLNSPNQLLIAHNEDSLPYFKDKCYLVHANITDHSFAEAAKEEKWLSYCYPGHLAGFSMGTNASGLAYTVNILFPKKILPNKIPIQILSRAILTAQNVYHLEEILLNRGCGSAGGFSINAGFLNYSEKLLWNFEIAPCASKSESMVLKIQIIEDENNTDTSKPQGLFSRYNRYNLVDVEMSDKPCDDHYKAVKCMKHYQNLEGMLNILSDTTDSSCPIFRNASPPDPAMTLATGVFDFMKKTWSIYVGNPSICKEPLVFLPLTAI